MGPSPSKGLERNPEQGRERYLTPDELRRLGKALREAETTGIAWVVDEKGPKAKHLAKEANRARVIDPHAVAALRAPDANRRAPPRDIGSPLGLR